MLLITYYRYHSEPLDPDRHRPRPPAGRYGVAALGQTLQYPLYQHALIAGGIVSITAGFGGYSAGASCVAADDRGA
ncbi:MAG TPA: hypothetical protein VME66_14520 [Candidatus Acidoferrales bacterium]|nr:hypothetical protein [Candidatus Acidoferrales bacterium]